MERYLAAMGETPELVALMRGTPAARLHWMTPQELTATGITTGRDGPGRKGSAT